MLIIEVDPSASTKNIGRGYFASIRRFTLQKKGLKDLSDKLISLVCEKYIKRRIKI